MAADSESDESLRSVTPSSEHEEYKRMLTYFPKFHTCTAVFQSLFFVSINGRNEKDVNSWFFLDYKTVFAT